MAMGSIFFTLITVIVTKDVRFPEATLFVLAAWKSLVRRQTASHTAPTVQRAD